jgi:hypothetical protein
MAFARNVNNVRTNGRTVIKINTGSGLTDIGFVAGCVAKSVPVTEETHDGNLPVGYDLSLEFDYKQTTGADYTELLNNTYPTQIVAQGPNDKATLDSPTIVPTLEKRFDGKTGSKIGVVAHYTGATKAQAAAFIANAS